MRRELVFLGAFTQMTASFRSEPLVITIFLSHRAQFAHGLENLQAETGTAATTRYERKP